jgi:hypothetical protein
MHLLIELLLLQHYTYRSDFLDIDPAGDLVLCQEVLDAPRVHLPQGALVLYYRSFTGSLFRVLPTVTDEHVSWFLFVLKKTSSVYSDEFHLDEVNVLNCLE